MRKDSYYNLLEDISEKKRNVEYMIGYFNNRMTTIQHDINDNNIEIYKKQIVENLNELYNNLNDMFNYVKIEFDPEDF